MYKQSKFNSIVETEKGDAIFNSISGNIAVIDDSNISEALKTGVISPDTPKLSKLLQDGYIVLKNEDEDGIARLKLFDISANKGLEFIIIPTTQCNFDCVYCYENNTGHVMDESVQNSIIQYVKRI